MNNSKLSPKQKKIAAMAGDPNKIEGEDFKKLRTMKANTGELVGEMAGEMDLSEIDRMSPFPTGSRASEKVLQDKVDKDAKRFKLIKDTKKALKRAKTRQRVRKLAKAATPGASMLGDLMGTFGVMAKPDGMKRGQAVMARGCKLGKNKKTIIT